METEIHRDVTIECCGSQSHSTNKVFRDLLIEFFRIYVEAVQNADEVDCIRHSLERFLPYLGRRSFGDVYIEFVFSVIEVFRSTNSVIIRNTLQDLLARLLLYCYNKDIELTLPSPLRQLTVQNAQYAVVPGCEKKFSIDSFFYETRILRNLSAVKRLLRYGVRFEMDDEILRVYQQSLLLRLMCTGILDFNIDQKELLKEVNRNYDTFEKRKRLYFIFLVLEVMYLKQIQCLKYHEASVKSLELLFKTILDPLISVEELERLFDIVIKDENKEKAKNFNDMFLKVFPRSAQPLQPRTLKHICRYQVRELLIKARKLPHGVWNLKIPKALQNYILIQEQDDEFYPHFYPDLAAALSTKKESLTNTDD